MAQGDGGCRHGVTGILTQIECHGLQVLGYQTLIANSSCYFWI
jgi:hypothetical protein